MRISIITPVFNGERFIDACLRSVIEQDCPEAEHLIIDGGSTDRSLEIVKRYADTHRHIRWISESDEGQSDAMNKGIQLARGELVGFLNADDFYEPGALKTAVGALATLPVPSLLIGNCKVIDDEGNLLWLNRPDTKFYQLLQAWRFKMPNNPSSYFYHRSLHDVIGNFEVNEHYVMDYDFLLKAFQASKVVYIDKTLGNYRMYRGNKTSEAFSSQAGWEMLIRVSRKHVAERGPLYRLHVRLGIALLEENLKASGKPSLGLRLKWRFMRDCLTIFDRVFEAVEGARG